MIISAVILTKNEEKNIERVIKSVDFCDEVIIVDDFSKDNTLTKITNPKFQETNKSQIPNSKQKIKIFQRPLDGDFAAQRNFGMQKAKNDWVLFVDADEEVSDELQSEIKKTIHRNFQFPNPKSQKNPKVVAYSLRRRDFFWGKEMLYGEARKVRQRGLIRLVKKKTGKWVGRVHEEFRIQNSEFRILKNFLTHYPHPTVKKFLEEINFYSTLRAKELRDQGKKTNIFEIILYPMAKFLLTYFIKLGFLDGAAGFTYAFMMSFHSFLVRAKLFQYTKINSKKSHAEINSA